MPIMNLLVAFNGSDASVAALRYGAKMARERGAHLTAILAHSNHETMDTTSRWIPSEARKLLAAAKTSIVEEIKKRFDEVVADLQGAGQIDFMDETGRVDAILSETARYFDLIIVGRPSDADDEHVVLHPDRIALMSGRPVLVIPEGYDAEATHNHAALAWDGSRSAARALSDSLRLLEDQGKVSVLTVGEPIGLPVSKLTEHLNRHDIETVHETWDEGSPVGRCVVGYCERHDPCFLVMGAYEHSKFREDFLGGVTARVLQNISIPVLLSH